MAAERRSLNSENGKNKVTPSFLVEVNSYAKGSRKVIHFLENTALVEYDPVEFNPDLSCSAVDQQFWTLVASGLDKNRQSVSGLIDELQTSGLSQIHDLVDMKQGYESKVLHILVHLLDGFIGMDSSFYNLIEDSHQISDALHLKIQKTPENYWVLQVDAENLWSFL
jgi:hypothetical protein